MKYRYFVTILLIIVCFWSAQCTAFWDDVVIFSDSMEFRALSADEEIEPQKVRARCQSIDVDGETTDCSAKVTVDQSWITVSPNEIRGERYITVSIDASGLEDGHHSATLCVEQTGALWGNEKKCIPVNLILGPEEEETTEGEEADGDVNVGRYFIASISGSAIQQRSLQHSSWFTSITSVPQTRHHNNFLAVSA